MTSYITPRTTSEPANHKPVQPVLLAQLLVLLWRLAQSSNVLPDGKTGITKSNK